MSAVPATGSAAETRTSASGGIGRRPTGKPVASVPTAAELVLSGKSGSVASGDAVAIALAVEVPDGPALGPRCCTR